MITEKDYELTDVLWTNCSPHDRHNWRIRCRLVISIPFSSLYPSSSRKSSDARSIPIHPNHSIEYLQHRIGPCVCSARIVRRRLLLRMLVILQQPPGRRSRSEASPRSPRFLRDDSLRVQAPRVFAYGVRIFPRFHSQRVGESRSCLCDDRRFSPRGFLEAGVSAASEGVGIPRRIDAAAAAGAVSHSAAFTGRQNYGRFLPSE